MFGFRPGNYPEPPPKKVSGIGAAPGFSVTYLPSAAAVNAACLALGANSYSEYNPHDVAGCTNYATKTIYAPAPSVEGQGYTNAVLDHEDWHSFGAQHAANGRGWVNPSPGYLGGLMQLMPDRQKAILQAYLPPDQWQAAQSASTVHFPASMTGGNAPAKPRGLLSLGQTQSAGAAR